MKVFLEQGPAEPLSITKALMDQIDHIHGIQIEIMPITNVNKVPFADQRYTEHWKIYTFFGGSSLSKAISEKRVEYVPICVSEIPAALRGLYCPDVALIQVTAPDNSGFCNFGLAADYKRAVIEAASTVIAQVNNKMPVTCGDTGVHLSDIDYIMEEDTELIQIAPTKPREMEKEIASYVADLVPDGSVIQIGIGSVPDAILTALLNKHDLGIHSGLLSDRMLDLIEAGVVTGKFKNLNPGKVVGTLLIGTERLYKFCHRNPLIELYPVTYTHNRSIVNQLDNFVSINSAIEVDLTGQVNSETINGKQLAGIGGQVDFARIARLSKGGISIIAIPSIANGKTKIVPQLTQVSVTRTDADYVITEYGIANLRYRSLRERAKALVQIAHPDFRKELSYWGQKV